MLNHVPLTSQMKSVQVGMELCTSSSQDINEIVQDTNHSSPKTIQATENITQSRRITSPTAMLNDLQNAVSSIVPHSSTISTRVEYIALDDEGMSSVLGESMDTGLVINQLPSNQIVQDTNHSSPNPVLENIQSTEQILPATTPILNEIKKMCIVLPPLTAASTDVECIIALNDNEEISSMSEECMDQGIVVNQLPLNSEIKSTLVGMELSVNSSHDLKQVVQEDTNKIVRDSNLSSLNSVHGIENVAQSTKQISPTPTPVLNEIQKTVNLIVPPSSTVTTDIECIDLADDDDDEMSSESGESMVMGSSSTKEGMKRINKIGIQKSNSYLRPDYLKPTSNSEPVTLANDKLNNITMKSIDMNILHFLFKNGSYGDSDGLAIWKWLESTNIIPGRSWIKLKGRFQTFIIHNMKTFKLNPEMENFYKLVRLCLVGGSQLQSLLGDSSVPPINEISQCYNVDETHYNGRRNDMIMLDFLLINGCCSDMEGEAIWKWLEARNLIEGSNWQQLKDEFKSVILPNINSYKLPLPMQGFYNLVQRCDVGRLRLSKLLGSNLPPRLIDDITATKEESDVTNAIKESVQQFVDYKGTHPTTADEMELALNINQVLLRLQQNVDNKKSNRKPVGTLYTVQEDMKMLSYIYKNRLINSTTELSWKKMEQRNVVPGRSYKSLRNRYQRILMQLENYELTKKMRIYFIGNKRRYNKDYHEKDSDTESDESVVEITSSDVSEEAESMDGIQEQPTVKALTTKSRIKSSYPLSAITPEDRLATPTTHLQTTTTQTAPTTKTGSIQYKDSLSKFGTPFELSEDISIMKYICRQSRIHYIDDNNMWKTMVQENVVPGRSFMSLKRHFKDVIMNKIEEYEIPHQVKEHFRKYVTNNEIADPTLTQEDPTSSNQDQNIKATSEPPFELSEDISIMKYICHEHRIREIDDDNMWKTMVEEKIVPGRTFISLKRHFKEVIMNKLVKYEIPDQVKEYFHKYVPNKDLTSTPEEPTTKSGSNEGYGIWPKYGTPFELQEDILIMKYLCRQGRIHRINDDCMWKTMVEENVVPERTFKSLKRHFKDVIMRKLDSYVVPDQVKQHFLKYVTNKGVYIGNS